MSTIVSPDEGSGGLPRLALIAGPTASGKSDLAIRLARRTIDAGGKAVVINADSAQVYADLSILSARPREEEMEGVPHVLFGSWDGASSCSAADWAQAAKAEIAAAHASGALPILVGGTGLYIRTLLDGIAPVPPIDSGVRAAVRAMPVADAYAALLREDPARAAALAPADVARISRALEVVRSTGHPLAIWQAQRSGGIADTVDIRPLVLLPDRAWLYRRCDARFEAMWRRGAVDEVKALLKRGLDPHLPVMRAIGVPEATAFIEHKVTEAAAIAAGQQATRNYAKRQFTWLRTQTPPDWRRAEYDSCRRDADLEMIFQV